MLTTNFNNILDLIKTFPNEQSCIDHLTQLRWNGNIISPFDQDSKVYICKGNKYRCKNTGKYFNVRTATMFDNTKVELQKWFIAIWLVTSHKKGISSIQLGKDLGVTQRTAWFILHRIRNCFGIQSDDKLDGEVEVDETHINGKPSNRSKKIREKYQNEFETKDHYRPSIVFGMLQRNGELRAKHVGNKSENVLAKEIVSNVKENTNIYSDEFASYRNLYKMYDHHKVTHSKDEFARGRIHTNSVESFWALFKRGIYGIYHFTSRRHLHYYVDEFVFRYNSRHQLESDRFNLLLSNTENRLKYKDLIAS